MRNHMSNDELMMKFRKSEADPDNNECHHYNAEELRALLKEIDSSKEFIEKLDTSEIGLPFIDLPAILVVEGKHDLFIYKWLLKHEFNDKIEIVQVGGRNEVLKVYNEVTKRRENFPRVPIIFIADQDMDIFNSGPPSGYPDVIWTKGYSIENELYEAGQTFLMNRLEKDERNLYEDLLETIIEWFAFEVEEFQKGNKPEVKTKIQTIVGSDQNTKTDMCPEFKTKRGFSSPMSATLDSIKTGFPLKFSGKHLFDMLDRYLYDKTRFAKYQRYTLYDLICDFYAVEWKKRLVAEIEDRIRKEKATIAILH